MSPQLLKLSWRFKPALRKTLWFLAFAVGGTALWLGSGPGSGGALLHALGLGSWSVFSFALLGNSRLRKAAVDFEDQALFVRDMVVSAAASGLTSVAAFVIWQMPPGVE